MRYALPGELWNQVKTPLNDTTETNVSVYLSEMVYKIPSVKDVMLNKEYWHTVCDFAERCGALRERMEGGVTTSSPTLYVADDTSGETPVQHPAYGDFQRFTGAGVGGAAVGLDLIVTRYDEDGPGVTFDASLISSTAKDAWVDFSVVPDINAEPDAQKVPLWFLRRYDRVLLAGTLMRLYAMSGRPWSDIAQARANAVVYIGEMNRITHGLITSGMRRLILSGDESAIAKTPVYSGGRTVSEG